MKIEHKFFSDETFFIEWQFYKIGLKNSIFPFFNNTLSKVNRSCYAMETSESSVIFAVRLRSPK